MSSEPLLSQSHEDDAEDMTTKDNIPSTELEEIDGRHTIRPGSVPVPSEDPAAPSRAVSSSRQRISDLFTIFCAGFALISDGYANSLMTLNNVVLETEYPNQYTSVVGSKSCNII